MFGPPPRHTVRCIRRSPQQGRAAPVPGPTRSTHNTAGNSAAFRPVHASMVASRHARPAAELRGAASLGPTAENATCSAVPVEALRADAGNGRTTGIGRSAGRSAGNGTAASAGITAGTGRTASCRVLETIPESSQAAATQLHASAQTSTAERANCQQGNAAIVGATSAPVTEQLHSEPSTSLNGSQQSMGSISTPAPHHSKLVPAVSRRRDLAARTQLAQSARPAVSAAQSSALRCFAASSAGRPYEDSELVCADESVATLPSMQRKSAQHAGGVA